MLSKVRRAPHTLPPLRSRTTPLQALSGEQKIRSLRFWVIDNSQDLLRRLGLVFGCLDFIVTPAGDFVFLEINEMGQFLFVEKYTDLLLLDAFSEFMLQGRVDFEWCAADAKIRYSEILPRVEGEAILSKQQHIRPAEQSFLEGRQRT
jgi:hypothetical protein